MTLDEDYPLKAVARVEAHLNVCSLAVDIGVAEDAVVDEGGGAVDEDLYLGETVGTIALLPRNDEKLTRRNRASATAVNWCIAVDACAAG